MQLYVTLQRNSVKIAFTQPIFKKEPALRNGWIGLAAIAEIEKLLRIVDDTLSHQPYLSGAKFGMADIALAPLVYLWLNVEIDRPSLPNLERWYQLLTERPAFKKIVMIEIN